MLVVREIELMVTVLCVRFLPRISVVPEDPLSCPLLTPT